jgi:ATP phosphoribosyltransferase
MLFCNLYKYYHYLKAYQLVSLFYFQKSKQMQKKLKIAIQKSGRLSENSLKLLKECGIDIDNGLNKLKTEASNFPIEVFFLRDDDITQYVADGVADIGIVGENVLL